MMIVDVNVLVALFRGDHPHHAAAARWWQEMTNSGTQFAIPDVVWSGFMRLATTGALGARGVPFGEAWKFIEALAAQPSCLIFRTDPRTMAEFERLGLQVPASGNLVSDAYIAACASVYGGTVVTFDRDFRKFDGVKVLELAA